MLLLAGNAAPISPAPIPSTEKGKHVQEIRSPFRRVLNPDDGPFRGPLPQGKRIRWSEDPKDTSAIVILNTPHHGPRITVWGGADLTASQARKFTTWLAMAADSLDARGATDGAPMPQVLPLAVGPACVEHLPPTA